MDLSESQLFQHRRTLKWKMSVLFLCLLVLLGVVSTTFTAAAAANGDRLEFSVFFNTNTRSFDVQNKLDITADAYGTYYRNYNGSYWNYFDAHSQSEVSAPEDNLKYSRALGFLEGYSTCQEIRTFYPNFYSAVFGTDKVGVQTLNFIRENYQWMKKMSDENASTDDYWFTIKATLQQINGLYEGFKSGCVPDGVKDIPSHDNVFATLDNPTLEHFLLMNAWGDLYQIAMKYWEPGNKSRLFGDKKLRGENTKLVERCSAIIKMFDDKSDISFGHATWDTYESLGPRIFKHYHSTLMRHGFAEHHHDVYFSSSPALLTSVDDFFTVSGYGQLGVIETTNSLYNVKLLELVVPQSVLSWARSTTSNKMAKTGKDWAENFSRYQSGTYTNQWMVMDLTLFTPGSNPEEGFLTVVEEVPGLVHYEDMTSTLIKQTYWPSYNTPYFEDISEASGYAGVCKRSADQCYDTCPRANIFREYQSQIQDIAGTEWMLMYNSYQNDSYSLNNSCNAIACRGDLPYGGGAFGALDAKVSSVLNAKRFPGFAPKLFARIGPSHDQQPVFCWSQLKDQTGYVHNGQPDCFDFDWVQFPPAN